LDRRYLCCARVPVLPNPDTAGDDQGRGHYPADDAAARFPRLLPIPFETSEFGETFRARSQMKTRRMRSWQTILGKRPEGSLFGTPDPLRIGVRL
jgi:hypothetical protein